MEDSNYYRVENNHTPIPAWIIEAGDDWELITEEEEPEYTILQWKTSTDTIYQLCADGEYRQIDPQYAKVSGWSLKSFSKKRGDTIWQVSRSSDSSIWTVGDKYMHMMNPALGEMVIEKFNIDNSEHIYLCCNGKSFKTHIPYAVAVPVPVEPTWQITKLRNIKKVCEDIGGIWNISVWLQGFGKGIWEIGTVKATPTSEEITIGDWITAECTHMKDTLIQVEGFMVNDKNNLLIKTKQFRTHGVGIENCKKVGAPTEKKLLFVTEDDINVYRKQHLILYWLETSTGGTGSDDPDSLYNPNTINYKYWASTKKRQQYIDSSKKSPEKPAPLMQVLLTQEQIDLLKECIQIRKNVKESIK